MRPTLICIGFLFLAIGCSTLRQQADSALASGNYDSALHLYNEALREDSRDPQARAGLQRAKLAWISHNLIQVRLLRLGNNLGESENLLRQILRRESEWQIFPTGAVFSTQNDEIHLYAQRITAKIEEHLKKKNPLAAQIEFNQSRIILEKALSKRQAILVSRIQDSAKEFCREGQKSLKEHEYYTHIWLQKTCDIWKLRVVEMNLKNSVKVFRDVEIKAVVKNLSADVTKTLENSLKQAFQKSKWHDKNGKAKLIIQFDGDYKVSRTETPVQRTFTYFVPVPYQEASIRVKQPRDSSSFGTFISVVSLFTGSNNERTVDNGDGTETVYTTRYRDEPRQRTYEAIEMKSSQTLKGELTANLDAQKYKSAIDGRYSMSEDRHVQNFPEVGLTPTSPRFITDAEWVESMGPQWIQQITDELQNLWLERFCVEPVKEMPLSEREQVFRCAYQVATNPPTVLEQYFLKSWGITYDEWRVTSGYYQTESIL